MKTRRKKKPKEKEERRQDEDLGGFTSENFRNNVQ